VAGIFSPEARKTGKPLKNREMLSDKEERAPGWGALRAAQGGKVPQPFSPAGVVFFLFALAAGAAIGYFLSLRRRGPDRGKPGEAGANAPGAMGERLSRIADAVEQAGAAVVVTDADGTIEYVNPAFESITGYRRDEVVGKNPRILKSGRQDEAFYRDLWDHLAAGRSWKGVFVNRRKDGTLFEEEAVISPLRGAAGEATGYVAVKSDVTEDRRREEQRRRAQRMEAVARLAGGVAHDFNNLLTAVIGYADLLVLQLDKEGQQRRHSEEIKRAGMRAATLTRQLLAFSRQQVMRPKDLDLNDVLAGMEPALRKVLGAGIGLSIVRGEALGTVRVDPSQLEEVVVTLALRAREAMPEGGAVRLETANADLGEGDSRRHLFVASGPYVMLAVTDEGPGMDEETQARLFEPFSGDAGPGLGLGLSSVYGIVKQSEGYIWAESEPGRGTTFRVYLPRVDAVPSAVAPVPEERMRGTETVLVVEDEPVVLELVREVLADKGYTVLTAANGEEGVKVLTADPRPIHLLLTDVVMPVMAGPDLAERAEALRPGIKVLFMSGYTEQTVMRHGVVGRRSAILQKPFTSDTVARKVREALDAPRDP